MSGDWIVRGARTVIADPARTYDGEHGVVLSAAAKGAMALVRLDAGEDVHCGFETLKPERERR